jgi:hypothetical protein
MITNKKFLRSVALFIFAAGTSGMISGQKLDKCRVNGDDDRVPKYQIGRTERTSEGPPTLLVQISVEPQYINRNDLVALASQLKKVFCKEQRVDFVIFDAYRYARNFSPVEENPYYRQGLESMRGEYYFDRTTEEDYVEFSTIPNYFKNKKDRVRVEVSRN